MLASAGCSLQLGAGSNPGAYLPLCGCCRHTGMITAQQLGRPVSPTHFRAEAAAAAAAAKMGWSKSYFDQEDLEAERLFDYGLLAPAADRGARLRLPSHPPPPPLGQHAARWRRGCRALTANPVLKGGGAQAKLQRPDCAASCCQARRMLLCWRLPAGRHLATCCPAWCVCCRPAAAHVVRRHVGGRARQPAGVRQPSPQEGPGHHWAQQACAHRAARQAAATQAPARTWPAAQAAAHRQLLHPSEAHGLLTWHCDCNVMPLLAVAPPAQGHPC